MEDVLRGKEAEREGVSEQAAELVCRRDWSSQCCWLLDADAEEKQWGKKISQATVRVNEWFRFFLSFFYKWGPHRSNGGQRPTPSRVQTRG